MCATYRLAFMLTAWAFAPAMALAYPISPQPLWPLTAEATLIVVAEVTAVEPAPHADDSWDSAVAHLRVVETLKGPRREVVEVPYAAGLVCPAPPRFARGETVIAFLVRDKKKWRTASMSYGTLYPSGEDVQDMITMVRAAVAIQSNVARSKDLELRKREWLVQAAALPGTRWHGLYELAPGNDRIRSFYDRTGRPAKLAITKRHRALLANALVDAPKIDPTLAMMLRVLRGTEDPRVDHLALGALEGLLALDRQPWWTRDLLWAVLARWGDPEPEARLEAIGIRCWEVTPEQLRQIWSEAKNELGILDVPPMAVDLEPTLPVGGSTPS